MMLKETSLFSFSRVHIWRSGESQIPTFFPLIRRKIVDSSAIGL